MTVTMQGGIFAMGVKNGWRQSLKWFLGIVFIFTASSPALYAASDPQIIDAAKKEGELVLWTASNLQQVTIVVKHFERKYPFLKTKVYRSGAVSLQSKIIAESLARQHNWDVTNFSFETILGLIERKLIARYISPERDMLYEDIFDREGYWTAIYLQPTILGYNTTQVKKSDVPRTFDDLLSSKWKGGKISIDSDSHELLLGLSVVWGREKAVAYLKKLAANQPVIVRGSSLRVQQVVVGEYPLLFASANLIHAAKQQGAPIDWIILEPAPIGLEAIMLAANAPHPNAGKLYIDFILSQEGQQILRDLQRIPARKDVEPETPELVRGYKRAVFEPLKPEEYSEISKLYKEIFDIR